MKCKISRMKKLFERRQELIKRDWKPNFNQKCSSAFQFQKILSKTEKAGYIAQQRYMNQKLGHEHTDGTDNVI